jgi:transcriptional regulator with XRE-family HTH domain
MGRQRKSSSGSFTKILIQLMQEKGMSVRMAAETAGVPASTVNSWRSGSSPTDFEAIRRLAKGLGVSFEFLLTGKSGITPNEITIAEIFEEESPFFDGYARISIRRLVPRKKGE